MRELRRHIRVGMIRARKNQLFMFSLWVIGIHATFVVGLATVMVLNAQSLPPADTTEKRQ